jgi:hypothetical protein
MAEKVRPREKGASMPQTLKNKVTKAYTKEALDLSRVAKMNFEFRLFRKIRHRSISREYNFCDRDNNGALSVALRVNSLEAGI